MLIKKIDMYEFSSQLAYSNVQYSYFICEFISKYDRYKKYAKQLIFSNVVLNKEKIQTTFFPLLIFYYLQNTCSLSYVVA